MSERRGPHRPSEEERSAPAAQEEAHRALAAAEREEARKRAAEVAAAEAGGAVPPEPPVTAAGGTLLPNGPLDQLTPRQKQVLADLGRLHQSLRGPQDLLETTGNFNRPVFPVLPRRR